MVIKKCLTIVFVLLSFQFAVNAQDSEEIFTIYLVRHAEKELNAKIPINPPLTKDGQERAEHLAIFLKDVALDASANQQASASATKTKKQKPRKKNTGAPW